MKPWRKVWLLSPMFKPLLVANPPVEMCLSLYYYISTDIELEYVENDEFGMQSTYNFVGKINVYRKQSEFIRTPIWSINPDFETYDWTNVTIRVPATDQPYQLLFEGILPEAYSSDMAIDSICFGPCTQDVVGRITICNYRFLRIYT